MLSIVKNNNFDDVLSSDVAFVDFGASWCGPCQMIAPVVEELAEELDGKVNFFSVDVDENSDLAQQFRIMSVPTLALFKNGKLANQTVGFQPKESLKQFIGVE